MKRTIFLLIILPLLISCSDMNLAKKTVPENQDYLLFSILWFQKSAEMRALYYQCYNSAGKSLNAKLNDSVDMRPRAVVMDIDETILDNSPVEATQVKNNLEYSDSLWKSWTDRAIAEPLPGALEFTLFAQSRNVEVFYISNRSKTDAFQSTLNNLINKGFPFADSLHLVLRSNVSSKEERREKIASKYNILLFIGDNLGDFDAVFDERGGDLGFNAVKQNMQKFGDSFIILPNPMYGSWVNPALSKTPGNTVKEKLINTIKGF